MPLSYETTSWELDRYFAACPWWGGAVARDQLPALANSAWVVNLQPSTQGTGTHWVAVCELPNKVAYFDSFGEPDPPQDVLRRMKETGKKMTFSRAWVQAWTSDACGLYCAFYIQKVMGEGEDPARVVTDELKGGQQWWAADQRKVVRDTRGVIGR